MQQGVKKMAVYEHGTHSWKLADDPSLQKPVVVSADPSDPNAPPTDAPSTPKKKKATKKKEREEDTTAAASQTGAAVLSPKPKKAKTMAMLNTSQKTLTQAATETKPAVLTPISTPTVPAPSTPISIEPEASNKTPEATLATEQPTSAPVITTPPVLAVTTTADAMDISEDAPILVPADVLLVTSEDNVVVQPTTPTSIPLVAAASDGISISLPLETVKMVDLSSPIPIIPSTPTNSNIALGTPIIATKGGMKQTKSPKTPKTPKTPKEKLTKNNAETKISKIESKDDITTEETGFETTLESKGESKKATPMRGTKRGRSTKKANSESDSEQIEKDNVQAEEQSTSPDQDANVMKQAEDPSTTPTKSRSRSATKAATAKLAAARKIEAEQDAAEAAEAAELAAANTIALATTSSVVSPTKPSARIRSPAVQPMSPTKSTPVSSNNSNGVTGKSPARASKAITSAVKVEAVDVEMTIVDDRDENDDSKQPKPKTPIKSSSNNKKLTDWFSPGVSTFFSTYDLQMCNFFYCLVDCSLTVSTEKDTQVRRDQC
jgi:hypothetical protein